MHHACYCRVHLYVWTPCITFWLLCLKYFRFLFKLCNAFPYAWLTWLYLLYLAMYLILWSDNQVITVLSLIFGHIWRISRRWLPFTLVFDDSSHWLIPRCCCCSSSDPLSWDWHIHQWLVTCQFSVMWPSLVPGSKTLFESMYLAHADFCERWFLKYLQLLSITPQKMRQTIRPRISPLLTHG